MEKKHDKLLKKKIHLSTHNLNIKSESLDVLKKTQNLPKISYTLKKLSNISSKPDKSEKFQFLSGFFMKKDFSLENLQNSIKTEKSKDVLTKTDSIFSDRKHFLQSSDEKRTVPHSFKNLEMLKMEILSKPMETLINLPKLIKTLENIFTKIHSKLIFIPDVIDSEIISNISELDDLLFCMIKDILKGFENIIEENSDNNKKISQLTKSMENSKSYMAYQINDYFKMLNNTTEQQYKKIHKKTELNDLYANFENQKLEKENEILLTSLKLYENTHNIEDLVTTFKDYRKTSEEKIQELTLKLQKKELFLIQLSNQITILKTNNNKSEKELQQKTELISFLDNKIEKLEIEKFDLNKRVIKYREIALMQKEDYDSVYLEHLSSIKHIRSLEFKMREFKKKLGYNMELLNNVNDNDYENDNNILKDVVGFLTTEFVKNIKKTEVEANNRLMRSYNDGFDDISLPKLQYYKPSFLTLIKTETDNKNDPVAALNVLRRNIDIKVSPMFLGTIRAIFDCKYNEMLICEDHKQITKLPEFVYSWLSNFYLSSKTRTVKLLDHEQIEELDIIREDFFFTLSNPLVGKLWECLNFKEFIEEKSSIDELYFYLHCRFLLHKGPQLEENGATFNYIHYVKNEHALILVDLIMSSYDEPTKLFLKKKLSEKAKLKNNHLLIDSAFVLRLLLEYYRLERKQKLRIIKNLFILLPNELKIKRKIAINSFKAFKMLIEKNTPNCTEIEKAELFRECWQVGLGEITPEIFFTVLTENNFFISSLKLKSFLNLPVNISPNLLNKEDYLIVIKIFMRKLQDHNIKPLIKEAGNLVEEMGNEKIMLYWERNLKVFSENFKFIDFSLLCGKTPEFLFQNLVNIIVLSKNVHNFNFHMKSENYSEFNDVLGEWDAYEGVFNLMKKHENANRVKLFEINKKVKIIQGLVKTKIKKWYMLINKLLKNKKEIN